MFADGVRGQARPCSEVIVLDGLKKRGFYRCKTSSMQEGHKIMLVLVIPEDHIDVRCLVVVL